MPKQAANRLASLAAHLNVRQHSASGRFMKTTNILAVAGPGSRYQVSGAVSAGFLAGFWHGLILPITFILSLFNPRVRIYEARNRGRLYDLGFILGASVTMGGGFSQSGHGFAVPGLRVWW
jgi:hypothetical protein